MVKSLSEEIEEAKARPKREKVVVDLKLKLSPDAAEALILAAKVLKTTPEKHIAHMITKVFTGSLPGLREEVERQKANEPKLER